VACDRHSQRHLVADVLDVVDRPARHPYDLVLPASITVPPVNSHRNWPARMNHHSSKSLCQWGRLPVPGRIGDQRPRLRSSAMSRTDHGGGPFRRPRRRCGCAACLAGRVITRGGIGPLTTSVMLSAVCGSTGLVISEGYPSLDGLAAAESRIDRTLCPQIKVHGLWRRCGTISSSRTGRSPSRTSAATCHPSSPSTPSMDQVGWASSRFA